MLSNKQKREKCVIHLMWRSGKTFKKYIPGLPKHRVTFILDYVQMDSIHLGCDVPQSTDQYMEPAQHGVQDVLNISTEVHVFHRTRQTDRAVYWTVPHTSGKELWLEPWPDDRSDSTGACLCRPTSQDKADGQTRINLG